MASVAILERGAREANFFDVLEDAAVNGLLLQGSVEAFSHAVGLRPGEEGAIWRDSPELDVVE
jgi:hypothetical protein